MKLIFFLIAFCLISIRYYFSWIGKDREKRGISTSNVVIKGDHFYEEMKYSGKFRLSDDETGFKSISPGGYFKFIKNEVKVEAESNLTGDIEYRINGGKNTLNLNERDKKLVTEAVKEMIYQGFDANARIERIYQKGGAGALINEVDSMRIDQIKIMYLNRVFSLDSLSREDLSLAIKKVQSLGSDMDKAQFLYKISKEQFKNPQIANAYFIIADGIHSDMDRAGILKHVIDQDSVTDENTGKILNITKRIGSDMDKADLYNKMIDKGMISGVYFDSLLDLISSMGSDFDRVNLYKKLATEKNISEGQWVSLINKSVQIGSDMDKSNLLIEVAKRMPRSEIEKAAYLKAAKSINNDMDYGRAIRALE